MEHLRLKLLSFGKVISPGLPGPILPIKELLSFEDTSIRKPVQSSSTNIVSKGDLLLVTRTGVGKMAIAPFDVAISQDITGITFCPDILPEFMLFKLEYEISYFLRLNQGTSINGITRDDLLSFELEIPTSKHEQTRIAKILNTADESIAQTEALIAKYVRIKTGLMQDLLTRGIDEQGNIRSKATHKFVVKNGIEVPEDWEVDTLGNNAIVHNHLRKPISSLERFEKKGIYPYFGATGIIDYINEFRIEGKFVLIGEDGDHYLKFEKQEMTHLVEGRFNVSNHAHILSGTGICSTEWIHYFFCHRDITYYLTRQGAGRFKPNKQTLITLPICIPQPSEQDRIIKYMNAFNRCFVTEQQQFAKLHALKTGLMQDLLSGKKRVNVENKAQYSNA